MTTSIVYIVTFLVCWTLLGRLIFGVYLRSSYLLHRTTEKLLAILCGPWLWAVTLRFKSKKSRLP